MSRTFVFVDISRKQEFIFKSNKLKDNIKNSFIIKSITEFQDHSNYGEKEICLDRFIDYHKGKKEYCGGGNSIISFADENEAKEFIRNYSRNVLETYPDLELYLSKYNEEGKDTFDNKVYTELIKEANKLKEKRRSRYQKISFGIERLDKETGFPVEAKVNEEDSNNKTKEMKEKARRYLGNVLKLPNNSDVKITFEFDDYKAEDKQNYIGIISIDGNGMGDLMKYISDTKIKLKVSKEIRNIYYGAVSDFLKELNKFKKEGVKKCITPIVSAGDDLCLVLDGKIAIDAAAIILENIKRRSLQIKEIKDILKEGLTACAGVAIVKAGYPFFDAYKEAERMCKNGKKYLHKIKNIDKKYFSIIDWQIVQGSNIEANDFIENLKVKDEKYHIKPLIVDAHRSYYDSTNEIYVFSYEDFKNVSKKINEEIDNGQISSSTLKKLQVSFYNGFESYEIDIEDRRKEHTEQLHEIIRECFTNEKVESRHGVLILPSKNKIYVLNDIIDSLKFLTTIDSN